MLRVKLKQRIIVAHSDLEFLSNSSLIRNIYLSYSEVFPSCSIGMSIFEKLVSSWESRTFPSLLYSTMMPSKPRRELNVRMLMSIQNPVESCSCSFSKSPWGRTYSISAFSRLSIPSEVRLALLTKNFCDLMKLSSGTKDDLLHYLWMQKPHTYLGELMMDALV